MVGCALALGLAWSPVTATLGTFMSETFTAKIRYTGITLGYQVGAAVFSGTAPMVAETMVEVTGGHWWPIPLYLLGLGVLSFVAVWVSGRTARREAAREGVSA
ncbi:hypothetical protein [Mobilicoccus caccae]|uniref:Major facilitator superfamily (MFS) profile domain-containing protein n=1 Tax=Mobilicoccus caccae TaxID=1859295 RepID=A0ABQ6IVW4_9MICO|nr:hypothetical protein [Mobilicoccus caccae]GMA41428.1 hypothetical protein GCM10025883_34730 [Mobilicoccus caccae]